MKLSKTKHVVCEQSLNFMTHPSEKHALKCGMSLHSLFNTDSLEILRMRNSYLLNRYCPFPQYFLQSLTQPISANFLLKTIYTTSKEAYLSTIN